MKKAFAFVLAALMLTGAAALADGGWGSSSRMYGYVPFAAYAGEYDGWVDIAGFGGVSSGGQASVRVISRNASVWAQPRTNSSKLGTVRNGEELSCEMDQGGGYVMRDGFYSVRYHGRQGWINSAYVVAGPLEIVLMQGNVPAYCAPDRYAKRVGSLNKLTRYTVLGFYDDFYVVSLREAAAFIPMSVRHYDTTFERYYHASWSGEAETVCETAVRTGPGEEYDSVRDMKSGQRFTYLDVIDGWCLTTDESTGCFAYVDAGDTDASY